MNEPILQAAVIGPAIVGVLWMAVSPWPRIRTIVAALVTIVAQAAAWAVFWKAFGAERLAWGPFEPDLLGATMAAVAGLAILVVMARAVGISSASAAPAVVGLAASTSAVVALSYTGSLIGLAVLLPVPSLACALAALGERRRADLRGLAGLAAADLLGVAGILMLLERSGSTVVGPVAGVDVGVAMLLAAAAVKVGAVPGFGTWRLSGVPGPGALVSIAVRAQGVILGAIAGLRIAEVSPSLHLTAAAGTVGLFAGALALMAPGSRAVAARIPAAGGALLFVALGLGGTVGARSFLYLAPAFLLGSAVVTAVAWDPRPAPRPSVPWRWVAAGAFGIGVLTLTALPPGGGFPGGWLTLGLASARGEAALPYLLIAGSAAAGLAVSALAAVPAVRAIRAPAFPATVAALASAGLLYLGAQPVRLGLGWLVRVERELGMSAVLPSAGAPELPAIGGWDLLLASLPALALVGGVAILAGRVRRVPVRFEPVASVPLWIRPGERALGGRVAAVATSRAGALGVASAFEAGAIGLGVWVVLRGASLGFL